MLNKIGNWIEENNLINPGDTVICAVSGGVDSMVMLDTLTQLGAKASFTVVAAHFNHHIRGDESDRDERFVEAYCIEHDITLHKGHGDVLGRVMETGESVEEAARYLRYKFLQDTLDKIAPNGKIATAHHANDNLETMLMKLIRGCGPTGICGIPPRRGNIIRPLLCVSRDEIVNYAKENGISNVEDSTNACDDYFRNRIRHNVIPLLVKESPYVLANSVALAYQLRQDDEYLNNKADEEIEKANGEYTTEWLNSFDNVIRTRIIKKMLERLDVEYSSNTIGYISNYLDGTHDNIRVALPNHKELVICKGHFKIAREELVETAEYEHDISNDGTYEVNGVKFIRTTETCDMVSTDPNDLMIKYETIKSGLVVRNRQVGDKIELPCGSKTVGRALRNKDVLNVNKASYPVIASDSGIIAIPGIGVTMNSRVKPGDKIIRIRVSIGE